MEHRLELPFNFRDNLDMSVLSLEEKGFILFLDSKDKTPYGKREYRFMKYDKNFQLVWDKSYMANSNYIIKQYSFDLPYLYFLIDQNRKENVLMRLDIETGTLFFTDYKPNIDLDITHFQVVQNIAFLAGTFNSKPVVVQLDLTTMKERSLPSLNHSSKYIDAFEYDYANNNLMIISKGKQGRRDAVFFNLYDFKGDLRYNVALPNDDEYELETFRPYFVSTKEQLIFGTYSLTNRKKSQGIYALKMVEGKKESIKFYDFVYLNNFFNYMPAKRREKFLDKARKRKKKGNPKSYAYDYFVNPLRFQEDRIIFSLASYYPIYPPNNSMLHNPMMGNFGMPNRLHQYPFSGYNYWRHNNYLNRYGDPNLMRNNHSVIYKFNHTLICGFDTEGKLLWDNDFKLEEFETIDPNSFFDYALNAKDQVLMLQLNKNEFVYKETYKSIANFNLKDTLIHTADTVETIVDRRNERIEHWYNDRFLFSGFQYIRNPKNSPAKRKVFVIYEMYAVPED
ncbi:MAG: hypothetical protein JJT94_10325 [Bernardetiaceae bacterium]|nr:hypothetical protein [Bernardetiaceae bacterium]